MKKNSVFMWGFFRVFQIERGELFMKSTLLSSSVKLTDQVWSLKIGKKLKLPDKLVWCCVVVVLFVCGQGFFLVILKKKFPMICKFS